MPLARTQVKPAPKPEGKHHAGKAQAPDKGKLPLKGKAAQQEAAVAKPLQSAKQIAMYMREMGSVELMHIRFSARIVERLCDALRALVEETRRYECHIQQLCVTKGNMPRPHFIKVAATLVEWKDKRDKVRGREEVPACRRLQAGA